MSEKVINAEAKGVIHRKGRVATATTFGLKVPRPTHEVSGKVAVASSSMPEAEKMGKVFKARRTATTPK